jgi:hypothetical protein
MGAARNTDPVRRFHAEAINGRDLDAVDTLGLMGQMGPVD